MRTAWIALAVLLPAAAQEIKLPPALDKLAAKASEVVDINMDSAILQLASRFLSDRDVDESRVKKLVAGLKSVYVKRFEFDNAGEYQESDLADLRAQLRAPGWARIVGVRSRGGDNAEVFLKTDAGQITGITVLSAEPRELTIVNIVGPLNPEDLRALGGHFGIPRLDFDPGSRKKKEELP